MQRNNSERKGKLTRSQKTDCYEAGHISKLIQKGLPKTVGFFIDSKFKTKESFLALAENLMWLVKIKYPDKYSELRFTKNDNIQSFVFKLLETYYEEINSVYEYTDFTDLVLTYDVENNILYENKYIISEIVPFTLDLKFYDRIKNPNMKKLVALFLKVYNSFSYTRLLEQPGSYNNDYFDNQYEMEVESIKSDMKYVQEKTEKTENDIYFLEELEERLIEIKTEFSTLQFETHKYRNSIQIQYDKTNIEDLKSFKFKKKTHNEFKEKIFELIELDLEDCLSKITYIGDSVGRVFENCFLLTTYYEDSEFELNNSFIRNEIDAINSDSIDPLFFQRRVQIGNKKLVSGDESIIERIPKAIQILERIFEMLRNDDYL